MNKDEQIKITRANKEHKGAIIALLQSEKLPVEDLPASLDNFFVAFPHCRYHQHLAMCAR